MSENPARVLYDICVKAVGADGVDKESFERMAERLESKVGVCRCGSAFDLETGVCDRTGILANHCDA